jgi:hypothetical protein
MHIWRIYSVTTLVVILVSLYFVLLVFVDFVGIESIKANRKLCESVDFRT